MTSKVQPILWMKRVLKGSLADRLFEADAEEKLNPDLYEGPFPVYCDPQQLPDPDTLAAAIDEIDPARAMSSVELATALFKEFSNPLTQGAVQQLTIKLDAKTTELKKVKMHLESTKTKLLTANERFNSMRDNFVSKSDHQSFLRLYRKMQDNLKELLQVAKDNISSADQEKNKQVLGRCAITLIEAGNVKDAE